MSRRRPSTSWCRRRSSSCSASLQHDLGLAMLFITHDLSVLVEVSDRLAIMYAGKIVEEGKADEVFHSPDASLHEGPRRRVPRDRRYAVPRTRRAGSGGDPPDPQHIPPGCPFHPRCAEAVDVCHARPTSGCGTRAPRVAPPASTPPARPRCRGRVVSDPAAVPAVVESSWVRPGHRGRAPRGELQRPRRFHRRADGAGRASTRRRSTTSASPCTKARSWRSPASPAAARRRPRARSWA